MVDMIISVFLTRPDKTVIMQKSKIVGNVYIRFVLLIENYFGRSIFCIVKHQFQVVLMTIEYLGAQYVRITGPFYPGNVISILQLDLFGISFFQVVNKQG